MLLSDEQLDAWKRSVEAGSYPKIYWKHSQRCFLMKQRASMPLTHVVWCQEWEESEAGWGTRPDGFTLHLTAEGPDELLKVMRAEEAKRFGRRIPDEYSRPVGQPYQTEVDSLTFVKLSHSGLFTLKGVMWTKSKERPLPLKERRLKCHFN